MADEGSFHPDHHHRHHQQPGRERGDGIEPRCPGHLRRGSLQQVKHLIMIYLLWERVVCLFVCSHNSPKWATISACHVANVAADHSLRFSCFTVAKNRQNKEISMLHNYDIKQLKATLSANIGQPWSKSAQIILEIPDSNTKKYT